MKFLLVEKYQILSVQFELYLRGGDCLQDVPVT